MNKNIFSIIILVSITITAPVSLTKENTEIYTVKKKDQKISYKPTKLNEILHFKDLAGGQYTVGYGYDPKNKYLKPFAIYDKTFSGPLNPLFWQKLLLASLGINDLNLAKLYKHISNKNKRRHKRSIFKKLSHILLKSYSHQKAIGIFPANWWKNPNISWKKNCKPMEQQKQPKEIPLNCIQLSKSLSQRNRLKKLKHIHRKIVNKIYPHTNDPNLSFDHQILRKHGIDQAVFRLQENGNYKLVNNPVKSIPPVKIIDLKGKDSSLKRATAWATTTNLAKMSVSFAPMVGPPQLMIAIMERTFNLVEVLYLIRHARALNLITEALNNNTNSPFYKSLSREELFDAVRYLKRSNTMLSGIIGSALTNKTKVTQKYLDYVNKRRKKSIQYLLQKNYVVYPFANSYYALGIKKNDFGEIKQLKVFSLIKKKTFRSRPHDVVDFIHPKKEIKKRNILEAFLVGTSFLCIPLPLINSVLKILYKELIIREMHRYQMQEAGFKAHLQYNREELLEIFKTENFPEEQAQELLNFAMKSISNRQLNPLELSFEEENSHKLKVENWLKDFDSSYSPL